MTPGTIKWGTMARPAPSHKANARAVGGADPRFGAATDFPRGITGVPLRPLCPVWLPPEPGRAWMLGWRGPHEAQGG
jgi:hypothetical protein